MSELLQISRLRSSDHFHLLKHGDEGLGHWYELLSSRDNNIKCGAGCNNPAKFIIYTHYHDNDVSVDQVCEEHASAQYLSLYEGVMSG